MTPPAGARSGRASAASFGGSVARGHRGSSAGPGAAAADLPASVAAAVDAPRPGAGFAAPDRVGLVGCVKRKLGHAAPAAELHVSPLFVGRRSFVECSCGRWLVLSALHGVVRPETVLEPYDVTLNNASRAERRLWAAKVLRQLDEELGSCAGLIFEIHAGANYTDFGLVSGLRSRGATIEQPVAGLRMGEQLAFYAGAGVVTPGAPAVEKSASSAPVVVASIAPQWEERDAWSAIFDLEESPTLVRACDWPADLTCLDRPGLYAWWVDEAGAADLSRGRGYELVAGRIYAGQAGATNWPSGKVGDNTRGKRIGQMHLGGKVRMSTFRWTLAAILFDRLGVQIKASMVMTPSSEQALTAWMHGHLSIADHPHDDRDSLDGLEQELLGLLDPPLNLRHMVPTPARQHLTELRRRISRDA